MGECGLSILLNQLKLKVTKMTQIMVTPFQDGIPQKTWWQWFKNQHPNVVIRQAKGLEMCRAQGLTTACCSKFTQTWRHCIIYINTLLITYGTMMKHVYMYANKQKHECWPRKGLMQFIITSQNFRDG
jgi:hypothetical protein